MKFIYFHKKINSLIKFNYFQKLYPNCLKKFNYSLKKILFSIQVFNYYFFKFNYSNECYYLLKIFCKIHHKKISKNNEFKNIVKCKL